jgi:hypothetical protein
LMGDPPPPPLVLEELFFVSFSLLELWIRLSGLFFLIKIYFSVLLGLMLACGIWIVQNVIDS